MVSRTVTVKNKLGLHARPAGVLTKLAQHYQSDVKLKVKDKIVNVKSIMGLLSAGVQCGTEIELVCNGADEGKALEELVAAVDAGLGEEE